MRVEKDVMMWSEDRIRQRYTMALLYCEWQGDHWPITMHDAGNPTSQQAANLSESWLSGLHECDWMSHIGLDPCGRHEQYQILRLSNLNLTGTIPPEISMLSSLWEITLSNNSLTGTIPSDLEKLTKLDTLILSLNDFQAGPLPDFVWTYPDMIHLDLGHNSFSGRIPVNISSSIRELFIEHNRMSGALPSNFGVNWDWQRLHLQGNHFEGPFPSSWFARKLRELLVHDNVLTGSFPAMDLTAPFVGSRSKLEIVSLYHNNMTGDVNVLCPFKTDPKLGNLKTFAVDLDQMYCDCCTGPP